MNRFEIDKITELCNFNHISLRLMWMKRGCFDEFSASFLWFDETKAKSSGKDAKFNTIFFAFVQDKCANLKLNWTKWRASQRAWERRKEHDAIRYFLHWDDSRKKNVFTVLTCWKPQTEPSNVEGLKEIQMKPAKMMCAALHLDFNFKLHREYFEICTWIGIQIHIRIRTHTDDYSKWSWHYLCYNLYLYLY